MEDLADGEETSDSGAESVRDRVNCRRRMLADCFAEAVMVVSFGATFSIFFSISALKFLNFSIS